MKLAILFALSCLLATACTQEIDTGEAERSADADSTPDEPTEEVSEPSADNPPEAIEEAEQDWTRADCYTAWRHNMHGCNSSPPNLRPACWAAASAPLTACLAASQG
jgi:hypothetical protein